MENKRRAWAVGKVMNDEDNKTLFGGVCTLNEKSASPTNAIS